MSNNEAPPVRWRGFLLRKRLTQSGARPGAGHKRSRGRGLSRMSRSFIVDAHLDLAYNALRGRDVLRPAAEQDAAPGEELPTIGLPDLRRGGVGLICATVFCMP